MMKSVVVLLLVLMVSFVDNCYSSTKNMTEEEVKSQMMNNLMNYCQYANDNFYLNLEVFAKYSLGEVTLSNECPLIGGCENDEQAKNIISLVKIVFDKSKPKKINEMDRATIAAILIPKIGEENINESYSRVKRYYKKME